MTVTITELMTRYWETVGRESYNATVANRGESGSLARKAYMNRATWWNEVARCYLLLAYRALRRETAAQIHKRRLS